MSRLYATGCWCHIWASRGQEKWSQHFIPFQLAVPSSSLKQWPSTDIFCEIKHFCVVCWDVNLIFLNNVFQQKQNIVQQFTLIIIIMIRYLHKWEFKYENINTSIYILKVPWTPWILSQHYVKDLNSLQSSIEKYSFWIDWHFLHVGCWSQSQLWLDERQGTSWIDHQPITGLATYVKIPN